MGKINLFLRKRINQKNIEKLKNTDFSLLCNNCNGAFISHDLGLRFNSPFVNLWMEPRDFLEYLEHFEEYRDLPIEFVEKKVRNYPIGVLKGKKEIKIYFQHYTSEKEANLKWRERSDRIKRDNLFVIMTDRDGCSYADLKRFNSLNEYRNKIVFTHKVYPELETSFYISGYEKDKCVGDLWKFENRISGKRIYDIFPFVDWFNGEFPEKRKR